MSSPASPTRPAVAAGEYAWDLPDVEELAATGAVDVVQADVTRCGGITNMLRVDGVCKAHALPLSAHCAPAITAHVGCAMETLTHLEYFYDPVRIENMLFDGTLSPKDGELTPDASRPGSAWRSSARTPRTTAWRSAAATSSPSRRA